MTVMILAACVIAVFLGSLLFFPAAIAIAGYTTSDATWLTSGRRKVILASLSIPAGIAAFFSAGAALYWAATFVVATIVAAAINNQLCRMLPQLDFLSRATFIAITCGCMFAVSCFFRICGADGMQCVI